MVNNPKIREYISDQLSQAEFRACGYVFDANSNKRLTRDIFVRLQSHIKQFLSGAKTYKWVALTGFRGTGLI